jgi:ferredoxin
MAKRKIIEIERDRCDGCGLCTTACAEGALALDDENKAVLVKEIFCDGLGACLDVCPTGALKITERESAGYSATAAYQHVLKTRGTEAAGKVHGAEVVKAGKNPPPTPGCPGSAAREISRVDRPDPAAGRTVSGVSELRQWPIQLHLVSPYAPYFKGAELLIAADCTAFSLGSFHQELLKGKTLVIACPKLDETEGYIGKLSELIRENKPKSITVAIMTVPCCSGLHMMVDEAVRQSGTGLPVKKKVIHIDGRLID